jgi:hypothetical protein
MSVASYPPPLDRLLAFGDSRDSIREWPNYVEEIGLGPEHILDLIRLATDSELLRAESEHFEVWAPIHAWRALGQLRAEAAIEPLMPLFHELDDSDWVIEEMPKVYGLIGSAAIPALSTYLIDASHGLFPRATAISSLEKIANQHPDSYDSCVAILTHQLERYTENDLDLNGFLVSSLVELKAMASVKVIECAFAAERVELMITGDWNQVQVELGLKSPEELPQPKFSNEEFLIPPSIDFEAKTTGSVKANSKVKAKRKMVKQSRKQNRKKRK